MNGKTEYNRATDRDAWRFRIVAIAAIGMFVLLVVLDLCLPVETPSSVTAAVISSPKHVRGHATNRVMMFSGFAEIPNGYSWVTGYAYEHPRTTLTPPIPYHSAKQSQVFQTMPILGPDGQYHESGYISGGGTTSTNSECRSCSMGGKEGSQVFRTMPILGPDGKYRESGKMPADME